MWLAHAVRTTGIAKQILTEVDQIADSEGFPPPTSEERRQLGRYAFSTDVIVTILLGVVSGVLTEIISHLLLPDNSSRPQAPQSLDPFVGLIRKTREAEEAIRLLQDQGFTLEEAEQMLGILEQAVMRTLRRRCDKDVAPGDDESTGR